MLSFTSEPLTAALECIGRPWAELWLRGSVPYFDVFARVCEVDLNGVSHNVCDALRSIHGDRDEAQDDGSFHVAFALWPLGHRFATGHRIRLQISSGAHPRYARNPGTGADPAGARAPEMRSVAIEVLRDAGHPARIMLPAMPGGPGDGADGAGWTVLPLR